MGPRTTRLAGLLTVFLGCLYVLAGIAETVRAVVTGDGGLAFWVGSLIGGGSLVLLGSVLLRVHPWLHCALVCVGALAGAVATAWTLLVPLLAVVVMALAVIRAGTEVDARAAG